DQRSASTLSAANAYTDARFAAWNQDFSDFRQDVQIRFASVDARIDRQGAMSSAMSAAAMNTSGLPGVNRVGIGIGSTNGRKALAVGYQRLVAPNASISLGGAFSGSESSISAGAGSSWRPWRRQRPGPGPWRARGRARGSPGPPCACAALAPVAVPAGASRALPGSRPCHGAQAPVR